MNHQPYDDQRDNGDDENADTDAVGRGEVGLVLGVDGVVGDEGDFRRRPSGGLIKGESLLRRRRGFRCEDKRILRRRRRSKRGRRGRRRRCRYRPRAGDFGDALLDAATVEAYYGTHHFPEKHNR